MLVRASWSGSSAGIGLFASWGSTQGATGRATAVPPDTGTVLLQATIDEPGPVTVAATNSSETTPVAVQLVAGFAPPEPNQ
jgi:hypothetical protein